MEEPMGKNGVLVVKELYNAELEADYRTWRNVYTGTTLFGLGMIWMFPRFQSKIPVEVDRKVIGVLIHLFAVGSSSLLINKQMDKIRAAERKAKYQYAKECLLRAEHGIRLSPDDRDS